MFVWPQDPKRLKPKPLSGPKMRSTRKKLFKLKRPRTEKFRKSFAYTGPKKWNQLPVEFHQLSDKWSYKAQIGTWITRKANWADITNAVNVIM